jgi:hypothetical protein
VSSPGFASASAFRSLYEITHTLFFEDRDGAMKPRRDAPTGDRLEAACQAGAGLLIVPEPLFSKSQLKINGENKATVSHPLMERTAHCTATRKTTDRRDDRAWAGSIGSETALA